MKRILSIGLLLFSLSTQAQTIHYDSSSQMSYVNITPVKAQFNDTTLCTRLYVRIFNDNLQTECSLYYELRDSMGITRARGNSKIIGETYDAWNGNNEFPFEFEADILNLEIVE